MLFCSIPAIAQTYYYKATAFTCDIVSNGYWSGWSDWEPSNVRITIDLSEDVVVIYSPVTQIYQVYSNTCNGYDYEGNYQMIFKFIDQDNDYGTMRLVVRTTGRSEIYIEFADVKWCYNVIRQ